MKYPFDKPKITKEVQAYIKEQGGCSFPNIKYRPRAIVTTVFGLTDYVRWVRDNGKRVLQSGWPGIEIGVDRGGSVSHGLEVYASHDFGRSDFVDLKGRLYGSEVRLYHEQGFRIMIAHMDPEEIKAEVMQKLKKGGAIPSGQLLGNAGDYGDVIGKHTHTECESWGYNGEWLDSCPLLDSVLDKKYDDAFDKISEGEILKVYRRCEKTSMWGMEEIFKDFRELCDRKQIVFLNKYQAITRDARGRYSTRYSTRKVFGM